MKQANLKPLDEWDEDRLRSVFRWLVSARATDPSGNNPMSPVLVAYLNVFDDIALDAQWVKVVFDTPMCDEPLNIAAGMAYLAYSAMPYEFAVFAFELGANNEDLYTFDYHTQTKRMLVGVGVNKNQDVSAIRKNFTIGDKSNTETVVDPSLLELPAVFRFLGQADGLAPLKKVKDNIRRLFSLFVTLGMFGHAVIVHPDFEERLLASPMEEQ